MTTIISLRLSLARMLCWWRAWAYKNNRTGCYVARNEQQRLLLGEIAVCRRSWNTVEKFERLARADNSVFHAAFTEFLKAIECLWKITEGPFGLFVAAGKCLFPVWAEKVEFWVVNMLRNDININAKIWCFNAIVQENELRFMDEVLLKLLKINI